MDFSSVRCKSLEPLRFGSCGTLLSRQRSMSLLLHCQLPASSAVSASPSPRTELDRVGCRTPAAGVRAGHPQARHPRRQARVSLGPPGSERRPGMRAAWMVAPSRLVEPTSLNRVEAIGARYGLSWFKIHLHGDTRYRQFLVPNATAFALFNTTLP